MDNYPVDPNTKLAAVCFNGRKPNLFGVWVGVTLVDLKYQLDQINRRLNHRDTRRVDNVGYRRPSVNSVRRLQFSKMMLTNDDVRSKLSILGQHNMFSTNELNVSLLRCS